MSASCCCRECHTHSEYSCWSCGDVQARTETKFRRLCRACAAQRVCPGCSSIRGGDLSNAANILPICQHCNGTLMPDVVFFGGTVPKDRVDACFDLINSAQGLIVIGSSLSVYSGYRFCRHAASQDKPLVILNQGKTRADSMSHCRFNEAPFSLLEKLAQHITSTQQEPAHG